jgi:2,4-dienoyl-CoA reductase-like NADH-dependent reductase (Old Yellow Enzyme family)
LEPTASPGFSHSDPMADSKPKMSILFAPIRIADLELKNRFVRSATDEGLAKQSGEVTEELMARYRTLAKGQVGLIISSHLYIHRLGRAHKCQAGIHSDDMIPGLKKLVGAVHEEGGKILLQLSHAGRQTSKDVIGRTPLGPSPAGRDPVKFVKPKRMSEEEIREAILAFGQAARRAKEACADGIQLHGAHGYLINQFLSPFFNRRKDEWGGTDQNRFRFLKEAFLESKKALPTGLPILVKINSNDYTPRQGITPPLAARYAGFLKDLGIDGLEVSCGTVVYSFMHTCRGEVPIPELISALPWWKKTPAWIMLKGMVGKYDLREGYNLEAAKMIKPVLGQIPLLLVGGLRRVSQMEEVLNEGFADLISMSRPFIRDPFLVKHLQEGKVDRVSCVSCNRCVAAVASNQPVRCCKREFPAP